MKRTLRYMSVLLAALMILGALSGCSGTPNYAGYADKVAAAYGDQKIYMDEANFLMMIQRWSYEDAYWYAYYQMYGITDMWSTAAPDGSSKTFGEYLKEQNMAQLIQGRILNDHAAELGVSLTDEDNEKIANTVKSLRDEFAEELFEKYAPVSDEDMTKWISTNALSNKVMDAVKQQAEVSVSDEECDSMSVSYVFIAEGSGDKDEEEDAESEAEGEPAPTDLKGEELANAILTRLNLDWPFSEVGELFTQITVYDNTYLAAPSEDDNYVKQSAYQLEDGKSGIFYYKGVGWYVVQLHAMHDPEATAEQRATLEDEQRTEHFNTVYKEWAAQAPEYKVSRAYENIDVSGIIFINKSTTTESESAADTTAAAEGDTTAAQG